MTRATNAKDCIGALTQMLRPVTSSKGSMVSNQCGRWRPGRSHPKTCHRRHRAEEARLQRRLWPTPYRTAHLMRPYLCFPGRVWWPCLPGQHAGYASAWAGAAARASKAGEPSGQSARSQIQGGEVVSVSRLSYIRLSVRAECVGCQLNWQKIG